MSIRKLAAISAGVSIALMLSAGCTRTVRSDLDYDYKVFQSVSTPEFDDRQLLQFESVFWEPDDTVSLRRLISEDRIAAGRSVLEIGTGTGLIALVCLRYGAKQVLATDINPAAVANARYNAALLNLESGFEVRQVDPGRPGAFSVIKPGERFDLIVSNPPWEDGPVSRPADRAFYDPKFVLMDSLLDGLPSHLNPGGRCLLAYGHKPAIARLLERADTLGYQTRILDDRKLAELPDDFLPGMLIEIRLGREPVPVTQAEQDR
jgi:predicted RNA methylase